MSRVRSIRLIVAGVVLSAAPLYAASISTYLGANYANSTDQTASGALTVATAAQNWRTAVNGTIYVETFEELPISPTPLSSANSIDGTVLSFNRTESNTGLLSDSTVSGVPDAVVHTTIPNQLGSDPGLAIRNTNSGATTNITGTGVNGATSKHTLGAGAGQYHADPGESVTGPVNFLFSGTRVVNTSGPGVNNEVNLFSIDFTNIAVHAFSFYAKDLFNGANAAASISLRIKLADGTETSIFPDSSKAILPGGALQFFGITSTTYDIRSVTIVGVDDLGSGTVDAFAIDDIAVGQVVPLPSSAMGGLMLLGGLAVARQMLKRKPA